MTEPYPTVSASPRPNLRHHWHCCHECLSELSWPVTQPRPQACPYCHATWIPPVHLRVWLADFWRVNIQPHLIGLSFYLMLVLATVLMGIGIGQLVFNLGR